MMISQSAFSAGAKNPRSKALPSGSSIQSGINDPRGLFDCILRPTKAFSSVFLKKLLCFGIMDIELRGMIPTLMGCCFSGADITMARGR
jgi:hypothetical protein